MQEGEGLFKLLTEPALTTLDRATQRWTLLLKDLSQRSDPYPIPNSLTVLMQGNEVQSMTDYKFAVKFGGSTSLGATILLCEELDTHSVASHTVDSAKDVDESKTRLVANFDRYVMACRLGMDGRGFGDSMLPTDTEVGDAEDLGRRHQDAYDPRYTIGGFFGAQRLYALLGSGWDKDAGSYLQAVETVRKQLLEGDQEVLGKLQGFKPMRGNGQGVYLNEDTVRDVSEQPTPSDSGGIDRWIADVASLQSVCRRL